MILEEFALLASDTARTKAYLQAMIQEEKLPGMCIVYSDNISKMKEEEAQYIDNGEEGYYFNINIPILYLIHNVDVPCILVENKDINSNEMEVALNNLSQKYLIYSGYGGYILKSHLFHMNKKFLHVHAGILPQYRGSTTIYYSLLQENIMGATAIFLSEGIDEGEIIAQDIFELPKKAVDIDYIYEPYIRSKVLIKVINQYIGSGKILSQKQKTDGAETYFIIHPLLKHLALLSIEKYQKEIE